MLKANFAHYPYCTPINTYSHSLGRAAREFVAALFAMDTGHAAASKGSDSVAARSKFDSHEDLSSLARQFDSIMPNQAAELRYLAGRDA